MPPTALRLRGPNFDISCPLGGEPPVLVSGGAVWEDVQRPQRDSLTDYQGDALTRVDVPIMFNGWWGERDVRPQVNKVLGLCRGEKGNRPPAFTATGPIPFSGLQCVMDGFPTENEVVGENGLMYRWAATVHLVEFNDPAVIRFRREHRHRGAANSGASSVVLQTSQTLLQVAAHFYRDASLASSLAELNGIRDVRKPLKKGTRIKLLAKDPVG